MYNVSLSQSLSERSVNSIINAEVGGRGLACPQDNLPLSGTKI